MAYFKGNVEDVELEPGANLEQAMYALLKAGVLDAPDAVIHHVAKMQKVLENVNNIRAMRVGNYSQLENYTFMRRRGCCASHDILLNLGDDLWLVGGNYGH